MRNIVAKTYDYIFAALLLLLPFGTAFPNIIIVLLIVGFVVDYKPVNFNRLIKTPAVILYLFLAYFFIKGLINQSLFTEWNIYKKFFILLIIPVLFLKVKRVHLLKLGVVISGVGSVLVSIFLITKYYIGFGNLPFTSGEMVNNLLMLERPYAGFFTVGAVIFSLDLIKYYPKYRKLFIGCVILLTLFIVIISARLSFLTLIIITGIYILFYLQIAQSKKIALIVISLLAVIAIFIFNKNIAERFFIKDNIEEVIQASDYEPRLVIWPCAYNMTLRDDFNVVFGYSSNTIVETNYVNCYAEIIKNESKKAYFTTTKFNSHNQFLDMYLNNGLIGLLLFISFFISLFYAIKDNFFDVALLLSIVLFLLVENALHRQTGCYIFSIFAAMLLMRNHTINDED